MHNWQPGDVAVLKSNQTTRMTVREIDADGNVVCEWLSNGGRLNRHSFLAAQLTTPYTPGQAAGNA